MIKTISLHTLFDQGKRIVKLTMSFINRIEAHNLTLVAAGVAFYAFLSIFPALGSAISIYGLITDVTSIKEQTAFMANFVPADVLNIFLERATKLTQKSEQSLSLGLIAGIFVSLWSANRAMKAITRALNIAHNTDEDRNFIKINVITLSLTLFSTLVFLIALTAIVLVPIIVTTILTSLIAEFFVVLFSWVIFVSALFLLFLTLYKYAPAIENTQLKMLMPGALFSSINTILTSFFFTLYVTNFGKYDEQYGALGAVIITLLWLFLSGVIFLVGAEINAVYRLHQEKSTQDTKIET